MGFAISKKLFTPSSTISISPRAESVPPIPSQLQKTAEPMVPIRQELQLKTKAEMLAHCDTQVRKTEKSIKISNKKFKAGNIASCLSKWKEIISDK